MQGYKEILSGDRTVESLGRETIPQGGNVPCKKTEGVPGYPTPKRISEIRFPQSKIHPRSKIKNPKSKIEGQPHVVVIGSLNMDLVARVHQLPRAGETVHAAALQQIPGGKGANQAVAVARLGGRSTMIGRVGDDDFGTQLRTALSSCGVNVDRVDVTPSCSSGVALISVDSRGENAITIVGGANRVLTPDDIRSLQPVIAAADAVLLQLEIPVETVEEAIRVARSAGVMTMLDPAPAPPSDLAPKLCTADVICPNRLEAEQLTQLAVQDVAGASRAARALRERGAAIVIIKLGEQGALVDDQHGQIHSVPAFPVDVVDTTAAGDAFTAATLLGLAARGPLLDALSFACAAGALATTKLGAQPSMPTRAEVESLIRDTE